MSKNLVVFGGNGFLGRHICKQALSKGWAVTSISRSGPPKNAESWMSKVQWKRADVFEPSTYTNELEKASAVIHSMGILLEGGNYKQGLNGGVKDALCGLVKGSNPMAKDPNFSYDKMNRLSAVLTATAFADTVPMDERKPYVMVSAEKTSNLIPDGYITSKRMAETEISDLTNLRSVFLRPAFMYESSGDRQFGIHKSTPRDALAEALKVGFGAQTVARSFFPALPQFIQPPLSVNVVAEAAVDALNEDIEGVIALAALKRFSDSKSRN
ncbi:hypothetical protein B0I72DRAFT_138572 [Yarrowia lipolytica]|uniref:YALI0E27764p n=2 Tax=Yarrowia lipolytica TaxID=4952 RepID=Q6C4D1_YARLI|nr:YALI0E27764p [Yarrowia lipolytica CLIB122]AOW06052.1 hypothetical protein YALI1_E32754g [Yarrowia lipolytica]KAB8281478.1 hypothetical protein BKA91DRAFT_140203 [Yarrowia lipolytica]KAE8175242.1 hypothetical protein BKA90DRAFT_132329 [Yarrowia lipolytica]KAJ8057454.1 hypothetical protein LXG23DRAFT_54155 [Yarrowia lipolytica]QNP99890.1 Hypothetical protein YALI2_E01206g [Yarrowia lipolytica]|eukprot:XP_504481.1 YALI0E27764p [Yarrowia lipolytica CLIB122]